MAIDNQPTLHRMVSGVQRDLVKVVIDYYGQGDEKWRGQAHQNGSQSPQKSCYDNKNKRNLLNK